MLKARTLWLGVLGLVPLWGVHSLLKAAEPAAHAVGARAARLLPRVTDADAVEPPLAQASPAMEAVTSEAPPVERPSRKARKARVPVAESLGTRVVSAERVLTIANAGLCPSGATAPAVGNRPAGVRVSGASRLGIGVSDGDVLTRVEGTPVTSPGDVVALVLSALARGQRTLHATLYRGTTEYELVVHVPSVPSASLPKSAEAAPKRPPLKKAPSKQRRELTRAAVLRKRAIVNASIRGG